MRNLSIKTWRLLPKFAVVFLAFVALAVVNFVLIGGSRASNPIFTPKVFWLVNAMWILVWSRQVQTTLCTIHNKFVAKAVWLGAAIAQIIVGLEIVVSLIFSHYYGFSLRLLPLWIVQRNFAFRFICFVAYIFFVLNGVSHLISFILELFEKRSEHLSERQMRQYVSECLSIPQQQVVEEHVGRCTQCARAIGDMTDESLQSKQ
jgi:hypothetical protein